MKKKIIPTLAMTALTLALIPSCVMETPDQGRHHVSYHHPARVTKLGNGNFIVKIDNRIATFDRNGNLMSRGSCNDSQLYHAENAVRSYIRGHRGDYMHPNYNYSNQRPPQVRPRGDGKIEVLLPQGGVVLYDANGRVIQRGGSVSNSELHDANKAIQSYLNEQNSSRGYDGV